MSKLDEFLAGERPEDVALFLTEEYLDAEGKLADYGEEIDGGVVLVESGEKGRRLFTAGTGMEVFEFAQQAAENEGRVARDLTGGESSDGSSAQFIFAFVEAQNEDVGGIYAEGDVVHAYASAEDGTPFSDRWVVGDEESVSLDEA